MKIAYKKPGRVTGLIYTIRGKMVILSANGVCRLGGVTVQQPAG